MGKIEFGAATAEVQLEGHTFKLRSLTVRELEGLVKKYDGQPEEELSAAIVVASEADGKLEGHTAEDFASWPVMYYRRLQQKVKELNGMEDVPGGN